MFRFRLLAMILASSALFASLLVANFGWWVNQQLVDSDAFADSTVAALTAESSRDVIAAAAVDKMAEDRPLVTRAAPLLTPALSDLLDAETLNTVLTNVAARIHRVLFDDETGPITIELTRIEALIMTPLEAIAPELAAEIDPDFFIEFQLIDEDNLPELSSSVTIVRRVLWIDLLMVLAFGGFVFWLASRKETALIFVGAATTLTGLMTAFVIPGGRSSIIGGVEKPGLQVIVDNLFIELIGPLRTQSRFLMFGGVALLAAGVLLARRRSDSVDVSVTTDSAPTDQSDLPG